MELFAKTNIILATLGEEIQLIEWVITSNHPLVDRICHTIYHSDQFYDSSILLTNDWDRFFTVVNPTDAFDGLPLVVSAYPAVPFDIQTSYEKGFIFRFQSNYPGTFIIIASWLLDSDQEITSCPISFSIR